MPSTSSSRTTGGRKAIGLGFLPDEARHGFLADVPKGSAPSEMVCISEHRGAELDGLGERHSSPLNPADGALRVLIDRTRWLTLAPAFWEDANRRLRANGLPVAKFIKNPAKPVPLLGFKIMAIPKTKLARPLFSFRWGQGSAADP